MKEDEGTGGTIACGSLEIKVVASKERYLLGWFHLFIQAMILLNLALCIWRYPPAAFRWLKDVSCCCAGGHKTLNLPVLLFFSVQSRPEEAKI